MFGARFLDPVDPGKAEFTALEDETVLARLLVERAAAHLSNRRDDEEQLRRRILHALPMRRLS